MVRLSSVNLILKKYYNIQQLVLRRNQELGRIGTFSK